MLVFSSPFLDAMRRNTCKNRAMQLSVGEKHVFHPLTASDLMDGRNADSQSGSIRFYRMFRSTGRSLNKITHVCLKKKVFKKKDVCARPQLSLGFFSGDETSITVLLVWRAAPKCSQTGLHPQHHTVQNRRFWHLLPAPGEIFAPARPRQRRHHSQEMTCLLMPCVLLLPGSHWASHIPSYVGIC